MSNSEADVAWYCSEGGSVSMSPGRLEKHWEPRCVLWCSSVNVGLGIAVALRTCPRPCLDSRWRCTSRAVWPLLLRLHSTLDLQGGSRRLGRGLSTGSVLSPPGKMVQTICRKRRSQ